MDAEHIYDLFELTDEERALARRHAAQSAQMRAAEETYRAEVREALNEWLRAHVAEVERRIALDGGAYMTQYGEFVDPPVPPKVHLLFGGDTAG